MTASVYQTVIDHNPQARTVSTVSMMNTISHQIEEQVIRHRMSVDFYAGFQWFSRFPAQAHRYQQLGAVCKRVVIFGAADVRPPAVDGITYIEIDRGSPLAQEWFLCVDTPNFWTLLSTREVSGGKDAMTAGRRYEGIWTFDQQAVEAAARLLAAISGGTYQPILRRNYHAQSQHIAEMNARMVAMLERSRLANQARWKQMNTLHRVTEALIKHQESAPLFTEVARILHYIMGAESAAIAYRGAGDAYTLVAGEGESGAVGTRLSVGASPSGQAVSTGALVNVPNLRQLHQRDDLLPTAQSILAAPLIGRRGVYGVVTIGDRQPNRWQDEDALTLSAVVGLLSAALENRAANNNVSVDSEANAKMIEQMRGSVSYMLMLHQKLRAETNLSPTQQQLLDRVMKLTMELSQSVGVPEAVVTGAARR
jgi:DICT domain-containing protein